MILHPTLRQVCRSTTAFQVESLCPRTFPYLTARARATNQRNIWLSPLIHLECHWVSLLVGCPITQGVGWPGSSGPRKAVSFTSKITVPGTEDGISRVLLKVRGNKRVNVGRITSIFRSFACSVIKRDIIHCNLCY